MSGSDVIDGDTIVLGGDKGTDCSGAFIIGGAKKTLELARQNNVKLAVLKERSPSCGSTILYTGNFDGTTTPPGEGGVCTALLRRHGIRVISENNI